MAKDGDTRINPATGQPEVYQNGDWTTSPTSAAAPGPVQTGAATGGTPGTGGTIDVRPGPGGRYLIIGHDILGNETLQGSYADPSASGGSGVNNHLTAAMDALNGFLSAQSQADARRLAAFDQMQKLGAFALPPGMKTAPGYEAGGPAHAFAAQIGLPNYTPPPITPVHVDPASLAQAPQVPPEVMAMINSVRGAA